MDVKISYECLGRNKIFHSLRLFLWDIVNYIGKTLTLLWRSSVDTLAKWSPAINHIEMNVPLWMRGTQYHFWKFSSVAQSCPTLCNPMDCSTPGLPVHHQLPELTQIHVHWVGDAIQTSRPLSSPSPPAFNLSQHQGLFQWVSSSHQVAKVLELQLQHQPSNEYSGLISFRIDWFDLLAVQRTLRSLLQHHSSKASILQHSAFFTVQLSHPYIATGRTIALTRWTFVGKVMSLILNMLSRFVIAFLPRNKHLWISWLQSASAVILEAKKINSVTVSLFFFIYLLWRAGTRYHDLNFSNIEI